MNNSSTFSSLNALAKSLAENAPKMENQSRRVRVLFNKKIIADTHSAYFVWDNRYYPQYYLPVTDIDTQFFHWVANVEGGEAQILRLEVGDRTTEDVLGFETGVLKGL